MRSLLILLLSFTAHFTVAQNALEHLKKLSSDKMGGREFATSGNDMAQDYIIEQFKKLELEPAFDNSYKQPFSYKNGKGNNIGVIIPGKTEKLIVVTAHFDHLGKQGSKIYNGADDNASGTAALFDIAGLFKNIDNKHSILIVALDAEEKGLIGAKHLVNNFPFELDNVAVNINMDMIAHNFDNELIACGTFYNPELKPILEEIDASVNLIYGHDSPEFKGSSNWTYASDHGEFHKKKVPFIYFGVADHKDYHSTTDTFENINQDFYLKAIDTIKKAIKAFDESL